MEQFLHVLELYIYVRSYMHMYAYMYLLSLSLSLSLSCSSQSLSQDPPSSIVTSNISGGSSSSVARTTSPVAAVVHSVSSRGNAGSAIPTSTTYKQPRRVKSPTPLKAYKISPSRKAKSTENLSLRDREETPVQTKKASSPGKSSPGKLARAKQFFGFRRSGESSSQSASLTDVSSLTPPSPGSVERDLSNPVGVSLSEGDADALNSTFVVEKHATATMKGLSSKEKRNGLPRKRGLLNIGNRPQQLGGYHVIGSGEDKHRLGGESILATTNILLTYLSVNSVLKLVLCS